MIGFSISHSEYETFRTTTLVVSECPNEEANGLYYHSPDQNTVGYFFKTMGDDQKLCFAVIWDQDRRFGSFIWRLVKYDGCFKDYDLQFNAVTLAAELGRHKGVLPNFSNSQWLTESGSSGAFVKRLTT